MTTANHRRDTDADLTGPGPRPTAAIPTGIAYRPLPPLPETGPDWRAEPSRSLLLVHDMQDHFVGKYDRGAEPIRSVITGVADLVAAARAAGVPVVFSAQPGDQDPAERALLTDFWGAGPGADRIGLIPELGPVPDAERMRKWRYSAFQRTDLHRRLADAGRDTIVICGIYANIGVKATALEAFMTDVRPVVVGDAVADFNAVEQREGLDWVARRCGAVAGLGDVLEAWRIGTGAASTTATAVTVTAEVLGVGADELTPETDLLDAGLDSVRAMELADRLHLAGVEVAFEVLMEAKTIGEWGLEES